MGLVVLNVPCYPQGIVIPVDKSIYNIFVESGSSLLILGRPGSGKTITLFQLAEKLLTIAEADGQAPIPLILNLSSWNNERLSFTDWLVEETLLEYQISRPWTRTWLENNQLILLLDSLDEINVLYRDNCIHAINDFIANYQAPIAICCRLQDYKKTSLNLTTAISIEHLTKDQIYAYLNEFGTNAAAVRIAIDQSHNWYDLATSPLMLNLMVVAIGDKLREEKSCQGL